MAERKSKAGNRTYDVTPDPGKVDTVESIIPAQGNPTDVRTFKAARTRTEPLAQTAAPLPFDTRGMAGRDGHRPTRKDCGDVYPEYSDVGADSGLWG